MWPTIGYCTRWPKGPSCIAKVFRYCASCHNTEENYSVDGLILAVLLWPSIDRCAVVVVHGRTGMEMGAIFYFDCSHFDWGIYFKIELYRYLEYIGSNTAALGITELSIP